MKNRIVKSFIKIYLVCILPMIGCYSCVAQAQQDTPAPTIKSQAPAFYRTKLGVYEITVLSDGTMLMPVDKLLQGGEPGEVTAAFKRNFETLPAETSGNCFLINTGSKLILVDAGGGDVYRPAGLGQLLSNMNAAGYKPEQIDAILVTHIHADHVGGLLIDGKIAFPNAQIYMHQADYDLLFSPSGEPYRKYLANEVNVVTPYKNAGMIRPFTSESILFPGISAVPAPGHTPGHTFYQVVSNDNKLLLWGDIVHAAEAQFPNPALTFQFDNDANSAKAQRLKIFADAAKQGYLIGGAHISFPGLGHVTVDNGKYSWIPVSYSNGNTTIFFK